MGINGVNMTFGSFKKQSSNDNTYHINPYIPINIENGENITISKDCKHYKE